LGNPFRVEKYGRSLAVQMFRDWIEGRRAPSDEAPEAQRQKILARIPELRGKDLLCWCSLDGPCHADTYLDLANR
jgi:hypothetical protein